MQSSVMGVPVASLRADNKASVARTERNLGFVGTGKPFIFY